MEVTDELGRRIRAASAYGGFTPAQLAQRLSVSYETFRRMVRGERHLSDDEFDTIVRETGLPPEFFTMDFADGVNREPADVATEITRLRQRVEALEAQDQAERLKQLAADLAELQRSVGTPRGMGGPP